MAEPEPILKPRVLRGLEPGEALERHRAQLIAAQQSAGLLPDSWHEQQAAERANAGVMQPAAPRALHPWEDPARRQATLVPAAPLPRAPFDADAGLDQLRAALAARAEAKARHAAAQRTLDAAREQLAELADELSGATAAGGFGDLDAEAARFARNAVLADLRDWSLPDELVARVADREATRQRHAALAGAVDQFERDAATAAAQVELADGAVDDARSEVIRCLAEAAADEVVTLRESYLAARRRLTHLIDTNRLLRFSAVAMSAVRDDAALGHTSAAEQSDIAARWHEQLAEIEAEVGAS